MCIRDRSQLRLAMMAFIVSGICDLFDGVVARRMKRTESQKRFGIEIDSLCDMISFAALPAVLLMTQLPLGVANIILAVLYVLAAVTRLAHFNRLAKHDEGSGSYFIGLPVTYSALFFPLTYLVCQWLAPGFFAWVWLGLSLLLTFLFVYNCRIPKPNKLAYLVFAILAIASLIDVYKRQAELHSWRRPEQESRIPERRWRHGREPRHTLSQDRPEYRKHNSNPYLYSE